MAYDVSALSTYVEEQRFPLLRKSIFGSKTASIFNKQTGIKHTAAINYIDAEVVLQSDAEGSDVAGGGAVKFSQRNITVAPIAVREFFDPRILNKYYIQSQLKAGSSNDEVPFEQELTETVTDKLAAKLETALWKGDVTISGNTDLNLFDGYLKHLDASNEVVFLTGTTSATTTGILATVDRVYENIPVQVLDADDMSIYMGRDMYRTYTQALKNANLFHYSVDGGDEFTVPGTTTKVIALNGLNGTKRIVAGRKSNFFVGCDLEGEDDKVEYNYLHDTEKVKLRIAFKAGTQVAFPSEIVSFKGA